MQYSGTSVYIQYTSLYRYASKTGLYMLCYLNCYFLIEIKDKMWAGTMTVD